MLQTYTSSHWGNTHSRCGLHNTDNDFGLHVMLCLGVEGCWICCASKIKLFSVPLTQWIIFTDFSCSIYIWCHCLLFFPWNHTCRLLADWQTRSLPDNSWRTENSWTVLRWRWNFILCLVEDVFSYVASAECAVCYPYKKVFISVILLCLLYYDCEC